MQIWTAGDDLFGLKRGCERIVCKRVVCHDMKWCYEYDLYYGVSMVSNPCTRPFNVELCTGGTFTAGDLLLCHQTPRHQPARPKQTSQRVAAVASTGVVDAAGNPTIDGCTVKRSFKGRVQGSNFRPEKSMPCHIWHTYGHGGLKGPHSSLWKCPLRMSAAPHARWLRPTDVRGDFGWWNGQMCMSHGEIFMSNDTEAAPQMRSDWQSGALNHWMVPWFLIFSFRGLNMLKPSAGSCQIILSESWVYAGFYCFELLALFLLPKRRKWSDAWVLCSTPRVRKRFVDPFASWSVVTGLAARTWSVATRL